MAYKDNDEESYPDIFENAQTNDDAQTRARVIKSLKALSTREGLDEYLNTEEIIKYFAVHDYLVAYDSYTGPMLHNFILYENDGKLAMLPWDYDAAYGSFPADAKMDGVKDSNVIVNAGIDSPLGGIADEARPMWNWILCDESYLDEYHDALSELADVIDAGEFEAEANRVYELVLPYIEKDPKAIFTPDQVRKAHATLLGFSELRAESVRKQVSGLLAARTELQTEDDRVDASRISIADMGSLQDLNS